MDTGSSFLGGGWGSTFGGGGGALSAALGGFPSSQGYSAGLLNQPNGFGQRSTPYVADNGQAMGAQNAYGLQAAKEGAGYAQDLARLNNAGELARTNVMARAETLPARLAQRRFNTVLPLITGALGKFGSNPFSVGGGTPPQPAINAGPVWTPQQVQGQVNSQVAQNDQKAAGQQRQIQQQTAGRGFGANSPLAQALIGQSQAANNQANAQTAQSTYFNTAQANAEQQLKGQQAQEGQWTDLQQAQIERAKPYFGLYNTLLGTLGSFGR